jgi:MmyB-like transcription regulator ligand binding domain
VAWDGLPECQWLAPTVPIRPTVWDRPSKVSSAGGDDQPTAGRKIYSPTVYPVTAALLSILNGMTGTPAYVRNVKLDILAANDLCLALYDGVFARDDLPFNLARFVFLDPYAKAFFLDWDTIAQDMVGALRTQAGRDPSDRGLSDLIGELATRSDGFAARWALGRPPTRPSNLAMRVQNLVLALNDRPLTLRDLGH